MAKTPFYFSENLIPLHMKEVEFHVIPITHDISSGFMTGTCDISNLNNYIPFVHETITDMGLSFESILKNIETKNDIQMWLTSLFDLSLISRFGGTFLVDANENQLISVPISLETHFTIQKLIADTEPCIKTREIIRESAYNVGAMLREGYGTGKNFEEAVSYYTKAAALDHAEANYVLGSLTYDHDKELSIKMLTRAAHFGHLGSQKNLALLYFNGEDVDKDIDQALYWAGKAEEYGDEEAARLIAEIKSSLSK